MKSFSLIATILNEGESIRRLLESLLEQSTLPDEIVLVDGGSSDETLSIIDSYRDRLPLRVLEEPGCNISRGRNVAVAAAAGDVIVGTDAGVRIPAEWFERITEPFRKESAAVIHHAAGFFHPDPDPHSAFEVAMSATVLPLENEIVPDTFLPSSRSVAFCKSAWQKVGGYPEWLDYSEDLIFDLRLKAAFGNFAFVPDAFVYFKPRTSLISFLRQYYRYARGDGKADLWRKRHAARYITYLLLIPALLILGFAIHPGFWLFYLPGAVVYLRQPYRRLPHLWTALNPVQKVFACAWIPVIRVVGDVAKMIGYPVGWRWRLQNHPPDWKRL